ncbi:M20/M25/M40 family metallo-hydrolase [Miltoncostaea marina]|uniref:M20/M25/M40 family metallo-hydrolase n=1 Tax=Miltoncostaea marina TaxID=2843215 RepID=UPI001C3E3D70|nr:M20/M25/M40 family metallo-hydrolase [Miltoncostaea marina]
MTPEELDRLYALLRVPSVSALPEHEPDMAAAAAMVAGEILRAGGTAEVRHGGRHPLVLGEVPASSGDPHAPRVVLYGHYDVQPPGPSELWTTPAFEPTVRDGNLYARGASDDKGNLFMLIAAVQRLAAAGELPVRAAFVVEGEEESGGTSALDHLAADTREALAAVIFDSPMIAPGRPAICTGVRGMVYRRVRVRTAASDAHSGLFGGAALNAAHALVGILAAVAPHGGRLVESLYAGVAPAGPAEVEAWAELPPGGQALREAGLRPADAGAEEGFHLRTLALPSLDVHGIAVGEPSAVKTNIPGEAVATLSLRVAPGQDAHALAAMLDDLLRAAAPAAADVEIEDLGVALPAALDPEHPVLVAAAEGVERATGWRPAPVRLGGTLPVVAVLAARGVPTVLTGFGLPDDAIHGPDEHLRVDHLGAGTLAAMEILRGLGRLGPGAPPL